MLSATRSLPASAACAVASPHGEALRLAVARAAEVWLECGVMRGEPVAVRLEEGVEAMVACLGVTRAGGVPVAVDPLMPSDEWQRLWSRAGWRFILAESRAEQPAALRDFVLTLAEWRQALIVSQPVAAESLAVEPS